MADDKARASVIQVLRILGSLDSESRSNVLRSVNAFYGSGEQMSPGGGVSAVGQVGTLSVRPERPSFSADNNPSPKQFLLEKQPKTDVERIACLAYFLTYFRETPYFKTLDLAKLNVEAAQPKFSNAAYASKNATKMGYLAQATKGQRQLSAAGEQFVRALPDRDGARAAMASARPRRIARRKKSKSSK